MRRLEEIVFWKEYVSACKALGHEPQKNLRGQVGRATLEINRAETYTLDEWKPLLSTLAKDTSLHYIAIGASSTRFKVLESLVHERDVRSSRRTPSLYSKYLMGLFASSLSNTVSSSKCLTSLYISKIPIKGQYLNTFCQGIGKTKSLQHLAIQHCPVEDGGCSVLCKALASRPTLTTLDLTDCALTYNAAEDIALLIKRQCCVRVSEVWKGSLRYGHPEGDDMPGLRRLTLNLNPEIGDKGVKEISNALQDDIWIKGVDMQGCGITEEGAFTVASLLEQNQCLTVFDLRGNPEATSILPSLMAQLKANLAFSRPGPYKCRWMEEVQPPSARVSQMTLDRTSLSSRGSDHGSESSIKSIKSNASEPPWVNTFRKPAITKKKGPIRSRTLRTQSLEVGVNKLKFKSQEPRYKSESVENNSEQIDEYHANNPRNTIEDNVVAKREPFFAVTKEQYEILHNFKKFTQSFVQARENVTECGDGIAQISLRDNVQNEADKISEGTAVSHNGGGDCQAIQPAKEMPRSKKLEAGDASPAEEEDIFKERTHRLLRKLIKLRNDRGLKSNEGVMRVCSQLSLPESESLQNQHLVQPSASYTVLPTQ